MIVMDNSTESKYVVCPSFHVQKRLEDLKKKKRLPADEKQLLKDYELYKEDLTTDPRQSTRAEADIKKMESRYLEKKFNLTSTKELYRWLSLIHI